MPVDPSLAHGAVQTLGDRQGTVVDLLSEEEPGKILHEARLEVSSELAVGSKSGYYGSGDATPVRGAAWRGRVVQIVPPQGDEFTCMSCFLVRHRSQVAREKNGEKYCRDCED